MRVPIEIAEQSLSAYIFSYSSPFVVSGQQFGDSEYIYKKGSNSFYVNAPIKLAPKSYRPIPQIDKNNFQIIWPGSEYPHNIPFQMSVLPVVGDGSGMSMQVHLDDGTTDNSSLADSLVILASGNESDNLIFTIEREVITPLFDWMRLKSDQWWIGRSFEQLSGNCHTIFPLKNRINDGHPILNANAFTASDRAIPVDKKIWRESIDNVKNNISVSQGLVWENDCKYYLFSKEYTTTLIVACSCIELERNEVLRRYGKTISDLRTSETDLLKHISIGFQKIIGRNLEKENFDLFRFIKSCWIARGHAAHGHGAVWIDGSKKIPFSKFPKAVFIGKLRESLDWIRSL